MKNEKLSPLQSLAVQRALAMSRNNPPAPLKTLSEIEEERRRHESGFAAFVICAAIGCAVLLCWGLWQWVDVTEPLPVLVGDSCVSVVGLGDK